MRIFSAAVAALWLIAAAPAAAETPAPYADLPGTSWVMTEWAGAATKPPRIPRLAFDRAHGFSGRAGCNIFSGPVAIDGARITLDPSTWTKMMCSADRMALDAKIAADLRRVSRLVIGGDGILTAHAEDGAAIFRFRRALPSEKN